jgi:hypothetical protein
MYYILLLHETKFIAEVAVENEAVNEVGRQIEAMIATKARGEMFHLLLRAPRALKIWNLLEGRSF